MDKQQTSRKAKDAGREDRLKAALKANMARRKAQTRARSAADRDDAQQTDKD
ncbi:MAG: hypothetical protein N4A61_03750 [Pelagimonas sp.]|jgi:hypothetical protein|nr:hypothetical protein [Pelagimonas sp.]